MLTLSNYVTTNKHDTTQEIRMNHEVWFHDFCAHFGVCRGLLQGELLREVLMGMMVCKQLAKSPIYNRGEKPRGCQPHDMLSQETKGLHFYVFVLNLLPSLWDREGAGGNG